MNPRAHIAVLDGWRGVSILLVLAAHLLPLGPKGLQLNVATGVLGMVIFFVLSGFLITSILLTAIPVSEFVARRFFRVIPLAWLYFAISVLITHKTPVSWWSHFLFYANLPPQDLVPVTEHMWSLCVEVQFYVGVSILYALAGIRGLLFLPVVAVAFTCLRAWNDVYASSITYYRIDEILAGCILALLWNGHMGKRTLGWIQKIPQWLVGVLLLVSCLNAGYLYLLRPYFAAVLLCQTMAAPASGLAKWLSIRPLLFFAGISYALYVIHPMLAESWLGSGDLIEKYEKRPLLFAVLFALAYVSTYCYERPFSELGKKLSRRFRLTWRP